MGFFFVKEYFIWPVMITTKHILKWQEKIRKEQAKGEEKERHGAGSFFTLWWSPIKVSIFVRHSRGRNIFLRS